MSLQQFHSRLKNILGRAGYSQQQLAGALNLHTTLLSNKLLGVRKGRLTNHDIKNIIKTLAKWEAIFSQKEVLELLDDLDLSQALFGQEDWDSEPLNRLEILPVEPSNTNRETDRPPAPEPGPVTSRLPVSVPADISRGLAPTEPEPLNTNLTTSVRHRPDLMTRLIGREEMLEELDALVSQPETRLLSLVGPGGIGKTRTALAVADKWARQQKFKDGVYFVELDKLTNAELVGRAILDSLSFEESMGSAAPFEILSEYLKERQILFILDNFEHVTAATPVLADLLASAPGLKFLVTSRVTMGIYGEWEFVVPPLPLPKNSVDSRAIYATQPVAEADLTSIALNPAVALFIERARAINHRVVLTDQNAPIVVKICQLLEGLPLALELAAARTRLFGLEGVLAQLQQSYLQVLNDGQAKLRKERHRSLQASLDWSYHLLSVEEQQLFNRLALFIDGFNIETVQAIVPAGGLELNLYEGLENLLNKSLLTEADESFSGQTMLGPKRYRMLQPIREYALERLKDSTTSAARETENDEWLVYQDYSRFWVSWVKKEIASLEKAGDQASNNRLQREYANVREVLELALRLKAVETVVELVGELSYYWNWRSQFSEWLGYIDLTLEMDSRPVANNPELMRQRGTMLFWSGFLAVAQMNLAKTKKRVGESLQLFTTLNDKFWLARSLNCLGFVESSQGNHEIALKYLYESLALRREEGRNIDIANGLGNLSVGLMNKGDDQAALEVMQEAHKLFREGDYDLGVATILTKEISYVVIHQGDYNLGAEYLDEGIRLAHKINNNEALHYARTMYGIIYHRQGQYPEARQSLQQGLAIANKAGDNFGILHNLAVYPAVWLKLAGPDQANARKAAALLEMLNRSLAEKGIVLPPMFRELMDEALDEVRATLTPAVFEACGREGRQQNLKETVEFVLRST